MSDSQSEVFDPNVDFFLINHRMNEPETNLPWKGNVEEFNRYGLLLERFRLCTECTPNIIKVDFLSVGDVLDFVMEVNRSWAGSCSATVAETMPWIKGGK